MTVKKSMLNYLMPVLLAVLLVIVSYYAFLYRSRLEKANRVSNTLSVALDDKKKDAISRIDYLRRVITNCLPYFEKNNRTDLIGQFKTGSEFFTFYDSAQSLLDKIKSLEGDRAKAEVLYSKYQRLINENADKLALDSLKPGNLIYSYLGLDHGLLPEEFAADGTNSVSVSAIILEDGLMTASIHCLEKSINGIGGLEYCSGEKKPE